jgi:hypothetical protein
MKKSDNYLDNYRDRALPVLDCDIVRIRLSELQLHRPRQWGACWLACQLWEQLYRVLPVDVC